MRFSIKELIVIHICYRDVFNAPVSIEALKKWIGIKNVNYEKFNNNLTELINEELIIQSNGFLARKTREDIILNQQKKSELTKKIISRGRLGLTILSKIPFVKFVGISGSLAADNPTQIANEKDIDLDLFIVTSKNTLWIFMFVERIFSSIFKFIYNYHFYCFNYVTEESFLEIYNKNFYTATEFVNLKSIKDKGVIDKIISCNLWMKKYYNINNSKGNNHKLVSTTSFYSLILVPLNYLFFILLGFLKSFKRLNFSGIKELKTTFESTGGLNFLRFSGEYGGGYQWGIKNKYEKLFKDNFKSYYSEDLMKKLFPEEHSFDNFPDSKIDTPKIEKHFQKYA